MEITGSMECLAERETLCFIPHGDRNSALEMDMQEHNQLRGATVSSFVFDREFRQQRINTLTINNRFPFA